MDSELYITNPEERRFKYWISTLVRDRQGELVTMEELKRVLPIWMDRGGTIIDDHSNRPVGKGLNFSFDDKEGVPGAWIEGKIFRDYTIDDDVWGKIKDGLYSGMSIGGKSLDSVPHVMDDNQEAMKLENIEVAEISFCERPANQGSTPIAVNELAKATEDDYTEKKVERRGDKWVVVHCSEGKEDKVIGTHDTEAEAQAQHRAIQVNKEVVKAVEILEKYSIAGFDNYFEMYNMAKGIIGEKEVTQEICKKIVVEHFGKSREGLIEKLKKYMEKESG